jgi:NAD-dependent deacetylase
VVMTGSGVSAESGVPTFRGETGLWRSFDAMALATPQAFARDPQGVWAWYRWRQGLVQGCAPNAAHRALAEVAAREPGKWTLVTQNVDGLHARAGSTGVLALHGDLFADRCTRCGRVEDASARALPVVDPVDPERDPALPLCSACGGLMRPGVVWFGEDLPAATFRAAREAARRADVLLVIGTSGVVYPAAGLVEETRRGRGRVVVVNVEATVQSEGADETVLGKAGEVIPGIVGKMGAVQ